MGCLYIDLEKIPEQHKKVDQKEKGEKNVDCRHDEKDRPG